MKNPKRDVYVYSCILVLSQACTAGIIATIVSTLTERITIACLLSSSRKGSAYVFEILMAPTDLVPAWVTTHTSYWFSSRRSSRVSLSRASLPLTRLCALARSVLLASLLSGCGKLEPALTLSAHARTRPSDDWSLGTRERERGRENERERGHYWKKRAHVSQPFPRRFGPLASGLQYVL